MFLFPREQTAIMVLKFPLTPSLILLLLTLDRLIFNFDIALTLLSIVWGKVGSGFDARTAPIPTE